ncbi:hypothetical protein KM043_001856 [Ampulex compressa]|nr:hypothetical protein KM043_001856 [Ampulex compressa]
MGLPRFLFESIRAAGEGRGYGVSWPNQSHSIPRSAKPSNAALEFLPTKATGTGERSKTLAAVNQHRDAKSGGFHNEYRGFIGFGICIGPRRCAFPPRLAAVCEPPFLPPRRFFPALLSIRGGERRREEAREGGGPRSGTLAGKTPRAGGVERNDEEDTGKRPDEQTAHGYNQDNQHDWRSQVYTGETRPPKAFGRGPRHVLLLVVENISSQWPGAREAYPPWNRAIRLRVPPIEPGISAFAIFERCKESGKKPRRVSNDSSIAPIVIPNRNGKFDAPALSLERRSVPGKKAEKAARVMDTEGQPGGTCRH